MTRANMIGKLEKRGRFYNWKRFSTKQIFMMYSKYVLNQTKKKVINK